MEQLHRDHIKQNVDELIKLTQYKPLIDECVRMDILSARMRQNIENDDSIDTTKSEEHILYLKHKLLFDKLTKRGPKAFAKLKAALINLRFDKAVQLLNAIKRDDVPDESCSSHRGSFAVTTTNRCPLQGSIAEQNHNHKRHSRTDDELNQSNGAHYSKLQIAESSEPVLQEIDASSVEPMKFVVKKAKEARQGTKIYPMLSAENRGIFFMVNLIEYEASSNPRRNGAELDGKALLYLFKELGFKLYAYEKLTKVQFLRLLKELITSDNAKKTECFVMALMTHGVEENGKQRAKFTDNSYIYVDEINELFENNPNSNNLIGKPKVFLYPFCRGEKLDIGYYNVETDSESEKAPIKMTQKHSLSDILLCFATLPGYKAFRHPNDGSWYVKNFCDLIALNAHEEHFEDILKLVHEKTGEDKTFEGYQQMGNFYNLGFNRKLYLNPGV